MYTLNNEATVIETQPLTEPGPTEAIPADPNDPAGVGREIIEEIQEIGRKYAKPRK